MTIRAATCPRPTRAHSSYPTHAASVVLQTLRVLIFMNLSVADVSESDVPRVLEFLREHSDTSMFLLSNLAAHGHVLSDAMNSGNFKFLIEKNRIQGVFCLTRRGNLLAECGGRSEFARTIVDACGSESIQITGVIGEWKLADAIWNVLVDSGAIATVVHASREPLFRLNLDNIQVPPRHARVRFLQPSDFEVWEPLNSAYLNEEELPIQGSLDQRRKDFAEHAQARRWWGLWDRDALIAIGALNAVHERLGQIGGVYTIPEERRRGCASRVMESLISDCVQALRLRKLILFTGENNVAAQGLYESLGFRRIGEFALLFGVPHDTQA
jgi:RimJ/RimL family protein N-acetyltransferase